MVTKHWLIVVVALVIIGCDDDQNQAQVGPEQTLTRLVDAAVTIDALSPTENEDMAPQSSGLDMMIERSDVNSDVQTSMSQSDMGILCTLEDCGLRVPELVDECSGAAGEFLLIGCEPNNEGECRWRFSECPEELPCIGITCEEPCDTWSFFDAGDGCNWCQCGPSNTRLDAFCSSFNCAEMGCRDNRDCAMGQFCKFDDGRCGIEGARGACEDIDYECEAIGSYTCGCDGSYGLNPCDLMTTHGTDPIPYGGCLLPDLGGAVACGPSVCMGDEFYCRVDVDDPTRPDEMNTQCEPIPEGCVQGDCSCFVEKLATHACFNGGGFVTMIQRTPDEN